MKSLQSQGNFSTLNLTRKSQNKPKTIKLGSALKTSKIKRYVDSFESKFSKNYNTTKLSKQANQYSYFGKERRSSIVSKMNSLRKSLLKMKGNDPLKDYTRNKLIVNTVSKLRNSVKL